MSIAGENKILEELYFLRSILSKISLMLIDAKEIKAKKSTTLKKKIPYSDFVYNDSLPLSDKIRDDIKENKRKLNNIFDTMRVLDGEIYNCEKMCKKRFWWGKNKKQEVEIAKSDLNEKLNQYTSLQKEVELLKQENSTLENRLALQLSSEHDKKRTAMKNFIDEFKEERLKEIIQLNEELKSIQDNVDEYLNHAKNILNEQDWKHLDIIIYQLETGRADTLKEALQQTDLYVRHNEIKGLMQSATIAICSTIKNSFDSLSSSISNQFTKLNSQVAELNKTSGGLSEKIGDLVSVQELNNALLKKANVSSEQLADDVSRLRQLKDYEYYGIN